MEKLNCIFLIITLIILFCSIYKDIINKNDINKKFTGGGYIKQ